MPEKGNMTSANKTKRPEDTNSRHLWVINYGERASTSTLAFDYHLVGLSRHVRAYCSMPYSSPGFICSDPFRHDTFRPLFSRLAQFPPVLGCTRLLVSVDVESCEVVQETPHPLVFQPPSRSSRPHQFSEHHALRESCVLHAHH